MCEECGCQETQEPQEPQPEEQPQEQAEETQGGEEESPCCGSE